MGVPAGVNSTHADQLWWKQHVIPFFLTQSAYVFSDRSGCIKLLVIITDSRIQLCPIYIVRKCFLIKVCSFFLIQRENKSGLVSVRSFSELPVLGTYLFQEVLYE